MPGINGIKFLQGLPGESGRRGNKIEFYFKFTTIKRQKIFLTFNINL